jgi:hypothetical protein
MDWTFRVMEIRRNPAEALPEEIQKLGGEPDCKDFKLIAELTDNFFLGVYNNPQNAMARISQNFFKAEDLKE